MTITPAVAVRPTPRRSRNETTGRVCAAVVLSSLLLSHGAWGGEAANEAQSRAAPTAAQQETAWSWLSEGDQFFDDKDYARALERYAAAYRLVRSPTAGMAVARAQVALDQWVEASATAVEVIDLPRQTDEPQVLEQAREEARELWRDSSARIPTISVHITPREAAPSVQIDGQKLPAPGSEMSFNLNPGEHRVQVSAPGYRTNEQTFRLVEKEHQRLSIALVPDAQALEGRNPGTPGAASGARSRGFVALGVAGVAALVGGTTGVLAFTSKPSCPANVCDLAQKDAADASLRYGNVATVSFGVGIVAGAYALWELVFDAPDDTSIARAEPRQAARSVLLLDPRRGLLQLSGAF